MKVEAFTDMLGADFYVGVPDSQLKPLSDYLTVRYGTDPKHHIIAANEGNCAALAAGYYLAAGKVPAVYLQNSGEGNMMNPVLSLLNHRVYGIPVIFVIGWRGEPGTQDEPQHIYQGEVTQKILADMDIRSFIIGADTDEKELSSVMQEFRKDLMQGKQAAFVIRKNALAYGGIVSYKNQHAMSREDVISHILAASRQDPVVCTTGKASRELFEIREKNGWGHQRDFLTVGSMGHCSSIALGIALHKPQTAVWCIDGDGAVLMHMGAVAVIGKCRPNNLIHVVLNNQAHDTVGGMPTAAGDIDIPMIAKACGYIYAASAACFQDLDEALAEAKKRKVLSMIEAKCALGARSGLGRPSMPPSENRQIFMEYLSALQ